MAGHSHSKNIMHQKGASDAKKAKIFNKLGREITVACKLGVPDPAGNPRLRAAIADARKNSMPRDRIERAIKSALPGTKDSADYLEIRYEGYGPGGCALIVEALTDNRNRTASELRTAFSKLGGAMGETGSVAFLFNRIGEILFAGKVATADTMLEAVVDAGADNVESDDERHAITTSVEGFGAVRAALEKKFGEPESARLTWVAKSYNAVSGEDAQNLTKLIEVLEDNDDVQHVIGNFLIDPADTKAAL
ncbi:MAG: YebC/PmpR family DNA-binding transcriptional regulator [Pseudomonadota bacterium]|nr:YebC/PmpR family DNA-binding transcriptional regulator [Pseudomonadota bacterium]